MKHPTKIEKYDGSLEELAEDIGNLRYDAFADFLGHLEKKIGRDGQADRDRGRESLSDHLFGVRTMLMKAQAWAKMTWALCKPHMDLGDETKPQD